MAVGSKQKGYKAFRALLVFPVRPPEMGQEFAFFGNTAEIAVKKQENAEDKAEKRHVGDQREGQKGTKINGMAADSKRTVLLQ